MFLRISLTAFVLGASFFSSVMSQEKEEPVAAVPPPQVWRGKMANVLEDPLALQPFTLDDGQKSPTLRSAIAVHFPSEKSAICWDAKACRLIYVWTGGEFLKTDPGLEIATPGGRISFLAAGPGHFAATVGAYGTAQYFGYKLVDGVPEFHYTIGSVAVRERITVSQNGERFHQHISVEGGGSSISLGLPEVFKDRVKSDKGTIKNNLLTLSATDAKDFTLTYDLEQNEEEAVE